MSMSMSVRVYVRVSEALVEFNVLHAWLYVCDAYLLVHDPRLLVLPQCCSHVCVYLCIVYIGIYTCVCVCDVCSSVCV
jgi:hypothetical protein